MSDIQPVSLPERPDTFTPEQQSRLRDLIREECYCRDRDALLKLIGLMLLLKLAGTLMLGVLWLMFRWF